MTTARAVMVASALALSLVCARASADAPRMSQPARAHLDKGLQLFDLQQYDAAIAEFNAGYQTEPRPDFLYAIGQAERGAGRCKRAIEAYRSFLRSEHGSKQTKLAQFNIERCEEQLAKDATLPSELVPVLDGAAPAGSVIRVDDIPVPLPSGTQRVQPGRHVVTFAAPGYVEQRVAVELGAREQREVRIALQPIAVVPTRAVDSRRAALRRPGPWAVLGVGLALTLGGGAMLAASAVRFDALRSECGTLCERDRWTAWQATANASYALLAIGGATALGGLAWELAVVQRGSHTRSSLALGPAGPLGLALVFD